MSRVVVVGAGISGLATAALLGADGHNVTVLEAREEIGGRAGTWEHEGFRWDTGPSWYLMPEVYEHFFRVLGTSAAAELDLVSLTPAYRVFSEGEEAFDVVSGRENVGALFESIQPGSGPAITRYLDSADEAYGLAVDHFLHDPYANLSAMRKAEIIRRAPQLARLLTKTLHGEVARHVSDLRLQQALEYPAVFLGGSPFQVPALYQLMSHLDLSAGVLYPQGGMTKIVESLAKLAQARGAEIRTGMPVSRIRVEHGSATGVTCADGTILDADIVISTADLHHTEQSLLGRKPPKKPRVPSSGAVLVMLGVRGDLPQLSHHSLLFAREWEQNFAAISGSFADMPSPTSLYVCHPSATDPSVAPDGYSNLFVLVPVPADPHSGRGGMGGDGAERVEAIADAAIDQLAEWADLPDLRDRIVVRRTVAPEDFAVDLNAWKGNALGLAHTLGQSALFRPKNTVRGIDGLFLAGTDVLPGIGVPMCLISAEIVAGLVRGAPAGRLPERELTA